jgi:hypothetical protein
MKTLIRPDQDEDLLRGQLATMADQLKELAELALEMLHDLNDEEDVDAGGT